MMRLRRRFGVAGDPRCGAHPEHSSGRGLPTSSPSANPVGGIGGILATAGTTPRKLLPLTLTAIGVVYGDIGTSPLYAMRECFFGSHSVPPTHENVLGVLSLIIYSLLLVISVKYIAIVMRADNQGEGGILALDRAAPVADGSGPRWPMFVLMGIFGAALLYGDGMITPAITVLGAVEGLKVATPLFEPYVVPIAVAILIGVFAIQRQGTHRVGGTVRPDHGWLVPCHRRSWESHGSWKSPWCSQRSIRGMLSRSFESMDGMASRCSARCSWSSPVARRCTPTWVTLDKRPIRIAWFALVLPALLLNYFGQGALLLVNPKAAEQPFFLLAPEWALFPLVGLATAAAIIASQALISGAFSLTRQAIQLGYCPRLDIEHTSSHEIGQVYVPQVNWALMISTIAIVIGFGSSTALAAAYGIAVTLTMVITAVLLHVVATERWRWPPAVALGVTGVFLTVDLAFFGANALKIAHGGWLPLVIGALLFTLMTTWKTGRQIVAQRLTARAVPLEEFMARVAESRPARVPGTAVFMTAQPRGTPASTRSQLALQQGAARTRRHPDGDHATGAPRVG